MSEFTKSELIDQSVERFMLGELPWVDMVWFWLMLWPSVECTSEEHYDDEWGFSCAYSDLCPNVAASMMSGPFNAADWEEWAVCFPTIGYVQRRVSNY